MNFYKDKKILVSGGTGLIGRPLVDLLLKNRADVKVVSLDDESRANPLAKFKRLDLTNFTNCIEACENMDYVFHLVGIKGSPKTVEEKPASYFVPTILFNTNMMEAARQCGVERYMFTSTIGVYSPAEIFYEDDVWKTFPSEKDRFAGWAKRIGELQAEAYKIEYGWNKISIVRPANVYGEYDNFDSENAMVVPSLIKRVVNKEDPLIVWGDGSPIRDFIHAKDVASGMIITMESGLTQPVNLGCGNGYSIKELVNIILKNTDYKPEVRWDITKPMGDKKRLMDISRAKSIGWAPKITLEEGIKRTINWYIQNREITNKRYDIYNN